MGTIAGILSTLAVAHLGGTALGDLLARYRLFGFGPKLTIARHTLKIGKAFLGAFKATPNDKTRTDLQRWLNEHDPNNESKLGDSLKQ